MPSKANDGTNYRNNIGSPKNGERGRTKKFESRLSTNIPLPVTMMRTQSFEKKGKMESSIKKTEGKIVRSRSTSLKRKEPGVVVLERVAKASKKDLSISSNSSDEVEVPGNKTTEGKLKGCNEILPLCERELRKIEDSWLSAAYCSLSMRANLFKFLSQSFPNFDRGQFYTEDKKLVQYFEQLKNSNKTEKQNLLNIIKSVLANREKAKEEYNSINKSERDLRKKITQAKEENKHLKAISCVGPPSKNEDVEPSETIKTQMVEYSGKKRESPLISFFTIENQQNPHRTNALTHPGKQIEKNFKGHHTPRQNDKNSKVLNNFSSKQNENAPKLSSLSNAEEHKLDNSKASSIKRDLEALKSDFMIENETLEKKVRDLENVLEEKIRKLKCEKEMKDHLNSSLTHFQTHRKTLKVGHGLEQLENLLGPLVDTRENWRKELWLTAIRLILSGFFVQIKNLETERNKMLYQLQSNDIDNFNSLVVTIIRKENFIKSIKHQMKSLNDSYQNRKNKETELEDVKN